MKIRHYHDNPRSTILVDFCLYNLIFCDEHGFSVPKKSAFFSIMKSVFEYSFSGERIKMEESLNFFKKNVMTHCVEAPAAGRVGVFSLADVKSMTKFIGETFYRNYTAYQVCFTTIQPVERITRNLIVETPLVPKPLDVVGSLSHHFFFSCTQIYLHALLTS
mmetsp:Transcript_22164/g.28911  ORF Transcript_22164/g.28911 Transcript_22164/m.28911 type:complete len:162 (-) Transcript_22164:281-766(-)